MTNDREVERLRAERDAAIERARLLYDTSERRRKELHHARRLLGLVLVAAGGEVKIDHDLLDTEDVVGINVDRIDMPMQRCVLFRARSGRQPSVDDRQQQHKEGEAEQRLVVDHSPTYP